MEGQILLQKENANVLNNIFITLYDILVLSKQGLVVEELSLSHSFLIFIFIFIEFQLGLIFDSFAFGFEDVL